MARTVDQGGGKRRGSDTRICMPFFTQRRTHGQLEMRTHEEITRPLRLGLALRSLWFPPERMGPAPDVLALFFYLLR